jgi:hypothetical protein
MILDDFVCDVCGWADEKLHRAGETIPCPVCDEPARRLYPMLQKVENFGAVGVPHTDKRRLSPAEAERHEHWLQTRRGLVPAATKKMYH